MFPLPTEYVIQQTLLALTLSIPIGYVAYKRRGLSLGGVVTAIAIAITVFLTGWQTFLIFLLFFLSSTLLTKWRYKVKEEKQAAETGQGRGWRQVIGAGGIASVFALALAANLVNRCYNPEPSPLLKAFFTAMLAAIATSNADTWAVEVGAAFNREPRLITKPWVRVPVGTSGGVTIIGELASMAGSLLISLAALTLYWISSAYQLYPWSIFAVSPLRLALIVFIFGWLGEILDSVVGATLQVKYFCPRCKKLTDKKIHKCGLKTKYYGGFKIVSNEVTNLIATFISSTIAFVCSFYIL